MQSSMSSAGVFFKNHPVHHAINNSVLVLVIGECGSNKWHPLLSPPPPKNQPKLSLTLYKCLSEDKHPGLIICPSSTCLSREASNFVSNLVPTPSISFSMVARTLSWTLLLLLPPIREPTMDSISSKNRMQGDNARAFWKACENKDNIFLNCSQHSYKYCVVCKWWA